MSQVAPPVTVNYKGYDVYSTGPWGQGPTFPQALKILEGYNLASMRPQLPARVRIQYGGSSIRVSQALNLAVCRPEQYVGDPRFRGRSN